MEDNDEKFAEVCTFQERVRMLVTSIILGGGFIVAWKFWFLPEFKAFATSAQCRTVLGINGVALEWYGLAVGLPLGMFLLSGLTQGRLGVRIMREGQAPPDGVKVLRRTRIKKGAAARRIGLLYLLPPILCLGMTVFGYFQVPSIVHELQSKHVQCTANSSIQRTRYARR